MEKLGTQGGGNSLKVLQPLPGNAGASLDSEGVVTFFLLRNALVKFSREAEVMGERLLLKLAGVILKP